jgi:tRNA 5-methylaminomethyl-2-thiouridine biosynthesis bifunctional protein
LTPYASSFSNVYITDNAIVEAQEVCQAMLEGIVLDKIKVKKPEYRDGFWHIESYRSKKLVLCTGAYEEIFEEPYIKLRRIYGQRCEVESSTHMQATVHHEVSVSATKKNGNIAIGASHYLEQEKMPSQKEGEARLIELALKSVKLEDIHVHSSFTGMRSGSNDYLPILGPIVKAKESIRAHPEIIKGARNTDLEYYPELYSINGVGGYGFVLAPYLSHLMTEHIVNGNELPEYLSSKRFFYRWAKKGASL